MLTAESIFLRAQRPDLRVGLGVGRDIDKAREVAGCGGRGFAEVILYNDARRWPKIFSMARYMRR